MALLQLAPRLSYGTYNVASGTVLTNADVAAAVKRLVPEASIELPEGRSPGSGPAGDRPPVRRAMRELPEYLRLAIHLADVDGFSYQEIAEITGTSAVTVATRVRDARRSLRRRLSTSTEPWP
jgi:DNA-directed RNA polymerase specialized sigma24 family protein